MSVIVTKYNKELSIDECWYDSSNIKYSKCYDKKDDYKDLEVVFKDGRRYLYKGLIVQDYLLFRSDLSQGKALNKYITCKKNDGTNKYEFEKLEKIDISDIEKEKNILLEEKANKNE
jgi:hypothetical protein